MRIKLTVSYDGTAFCGWQRQTGCLSVQQTIEEALSELLGEDIKITGSGRTDAGVHAEGQVAHFDTKNENFPPEGFARALNTMLPKDVKVIKSERVKKDFDACRTAKKKTYRYSVYLSDVIKPLKDRYSTQIIDRPKIDIAAIKKGAELFIGKHDFKAFCASGSSVKTTEREIYSFKVISRGEDLSFTVCGNGFLYNMVRIMTGVLIMLGQNKIKEEDIKKMLETGKRPCSIKTLPAKGLTLLKAEY